MTLEMPAQTQDPQPKHETLLGNKASTRPVNGLLLARKLGFNEGEILELARLYPTLETAGAGQNDNVRAKSIGGAAAASAKTRGTR